MTVTIKKIGARSAARFLGWVYLIVGALFGLIYLLLVIVPMFFTETEFTLELLIPFIILLVYGLIGWIGGYLGAWIYNFVASHFGGIEIEFEESLRTPTSGT